MQHREKSHRKVFFLLFSILAIFLAIPLIKGNYFSFFGRDIDLKRSDSTINVLLMGRGGGSHDGPDLTDTMIFTSIDEKSKKISMISIPRDLWIPDLQAKINTAYAYGKERQTDGGITLSKAIVSKIVGQPIDYVVVVDFAGFVKAVDELGGLDITVDKTFDDYEYPVETKREELCGHTLEEATELIASMSAQEVFPCRYTHVHFDKGPQHMSGEETLIFVRSRYGTNGEGSDFARSKRQQKVIQAVREKVFSLGILLNPIKVSNLFNLVKNSIDTNVQEGEIDDFVKLASRLKDAKISSHILEIEDNAAEKAGLLTHPPLEDFDGRWVLIPRAGDGNYSEIQEFAACAQKSDVCMVTPTE